jgi:subtilase family serine protease
MKKYILPAIFVILFCLSCDSDNADTMNVFGDDEPDPDALSEGPVENDVVLNIVLGLARSQDSLADRIEELHDPVSPRYHDFRSVPEIAEEFGAEDSVIESVQGFLNAQGISLDVDQTKGFLHGQATAAQLNQIFDTKLFYYKSDEGTFIAPSESPTLPAPLVGLVTEVLGLSTEPSLWEVPEPDDPDEAISPSVVIDTPGSPTVTGTREGCAEALKRNGFTPNQFRTAYGIDPLHRRGYRGEGITFALVEGTRFEQSNIDEFTSCFEISDPVVPTVVQLGSDELKPDGEPFLDIEVVLMIAPKLSGLYVFQKKLNSLADWVTLFSAPLNTKHTAGVPVQIMSGSLGNCEVKWGFAAISMMEYVFMNAAASGVHVFISAGDSGSSTCYHHDKKTKTKSAEYPASSQYVTGVGGTNLALNEDNTIKGEGVWNDHDFPAPYNKKFGAGGGGKSRFLSRPLWQKGTKIKGFRRATPDVAFFADPFPGYVVNDSLRGWFDNGGTSAATPFFAASMALVLQAAEENGITLDLTYEMIYKLANSNAYDGVFQDVVIGNNDIFDVGCCTAGPRYDMASGWGSLNINSLAEVLIPSLRN